MIFDIRGVVVREMGEEAGEKGVEGMIVEVRGRVVVVG